MPQTINQLIYLLASSYPSYRPNPDILKIYSGKLRDYPIGVVQQACSDIVETNKYFPTISELVAVIRKIQSTWNDKERSRREMLPPLPKEIATFDNLSFELMVKNGYDSVDEITEAELQNNIALSSMEARV
jgi:hypothetical protein